MNLPVGLAGDGHVVEVSSVVLWVGSPEEQLTTWFSVGIPEKRQDGEKTLNRAAVRQVNPIQMKSVYY